MTRSSLGRIYDRVHGAACGRAPRERPWHHQWLSGKIVYADLRRVLPQLRGRVLDVGCREKPYAPWLGSQVTEHVGLDIEPGAHVDHVVAPDGGWPLPDASFDAVLCTQVFEHVRDLDVVLRETARVLRPGGLLVASVPFIYPEHGASGHDYRRFSTGGVERALAADFETLEVRPQGGAGSTLGTLWLAWLDAAMDQGRVSRRLKGLLLPLWMLVSAAVNALALAVDSIDRTGRFYGNVFVVARRRAAPAVAAASA